MAAFDILRIIERAAFGVVGEVYVDKCINGSDSELWRSMTRRAPEHSLLATPRDWPQKQVQTAVRACWQCSRSDYLTFSKDVPHNPAQPYEDRFMRKVREKGSCNHCVPLTKLARRKK